MKTCTKCNTERTVDLFFKSKVSQDGLSYWCRPCQASYRRERRQSDPEFRKHSNSKNADYRRKRWSADLEYRCHKNTKTAAYNKRRGANDRVFAIKSHVRSLIYNSLRRRNITKNTRTEAILGIDLISFIQQIDKMAVELYGVPYNSTDMDIDHIIPLHTAETEEQVLKLNHHSNLRPLSKADHKDKTKLDLDLYYGV